MIVDSCRFIDVRVSIELKTFWLAKHNIDSAKQKTISAAFNVLVLAERCAELSSIAYQYGHISNDEYRALRNAVNKAEKAYKAAISA